jgi:VCBS repeat-containing protein
MKRIFMLMAPLALMLVAAMALSGVAQAGTSTSTLASPKPITYVCANKSTGQLFYLSSSCASSQTSVAVTSASTQFKACYLTSNGVTRKVSASTKCSDNPRTKENTIEKVPADSSSLYFCVKSSDGTMFFKPGTTAPTCPTGQYAVVIGPHNQAPSAAGDSYSVAEDGTLSVPAPGVLSNDSDPDGDTMTAQLATGPSHGTLTLNSDGAFSYTPNADYNGVDSFTYKASDGTADSNVATATITVNPTDAQCKTLAIQTLGPSFNPSNYTFHAGTAGNGSFDGKATAGNDVFCGFGGDDFIDTLGEGDIFLGGDGNDVVNNNYGTFNGEAGNDRVTTNVGTFNGGDGLDTVTTNISGGTFNGGDGNDSVDRNYWTFNGGAGDDFVTLNYWAFNGGDGNDVVNNNYGTFNGDGGDDRVTFNYGDFFGGVGNDSVSVNQGTFNGGDGNDSVVTNNGGTLVDVP